MNAHTLSFIADAVRFAAADHGIRDMKMGVSENLRTFTVDPITVYVRNDDNQIRVTVENRGIIAEATFSNMPDTVIAPVVISYLFAK